MSEPSPPAPDPTSKPGEPSPAHSSAGEEDPGAALDDPALREAMRGETERSGTRPAAPADTPRRGR